MVGATLHLKTYGFTQGCSPPRSPPANPSPVPASTLDSPSRQTSSGTPVISECCCSKALPHSAQNLDKMIFRLPCSTSATLGCFSGCHEPAALNLYFPPPHWDIANQQQNTRRSSEKKSHHHVCSTDDFIPITCSCHAKRATGEDLNPDPDNTTAKNEDAAPSIYFRFLHAGISPSEAGESPRSALGGQTDIKAQLHIWI